MDALTVGGVAAALLYLINAVWAQINPNRRHGAAIDMAVLGVVTGTMILLVIAR